MQCECCPQHLSGSNHYMWTLQIPNIHFMNKIKIKSKITPKAEMRYWDKQQSQYSHSNKEWLFGCQTRRWILFNQGQSTEAKLMNGLIGIQWGEICVNLPIILSNMQAVGTDIVTERKTKKVSENQAEKGTRRLEALMCSKQTWETAVLYPKACSYIWIPQIPLHLIRRKYMAVQSGENQCETRAFTLLYSSNKYLLSTCCK